GFARALHKLARGELGLQLQAALDELARLDAPRQLGQCLEARGALRLRNGDVSGAAEDAAAVLALGRRMDLPRLVAAANALLAETALARGDAGAAREAAAAPVDVERVPVSLAEKLA